MLLELQNQFDLFDHINAVRPVNLITLSMTLNALGTPEAQDELIKIEQEQGQWLESISSKWSFLLLSVIYRSSIF